MSSDSMTLLVIACLGLAGFCIYRLYQSSQQKKRHALTDPSRIESWMKAETFAPNHFSFYLGTAVAIKNDDPRIVLAKASTPKFHNFSEVQSIKAHETVASMRPLSAAPGVVEKREFRRFNIDFTFKTPHAPTCRILFPDADQMLAWEVRLRQLMTTQN